MLEEQGGAGAGALSLTQVRLLYEMATRSDLTARRLTQELGLNAGYLSRLLSGFEQRGLIKRAASEEDGREKRLQLTAAGRRFFKPLYEAAQQRAAALISPLDAIERGRLLAAMNVIQQLLDPAWERSAKAAAPEVLIREHQAGDIGWVISLHGELYCREYGWNADFESLVARIGADFLKNFDPEGERAWIVEVVGERVGCAMVVRSSRTVAKLRLVLLDPRARGLGLGRRLVQDAIAFARRCGYRKLTLWTNDCLHAARAIYVAEGFRLVKEEPHLSFGKQLTGQYWALSLSPAGSEHRIEDQGRKEGGGQAPGSLHDDPPMIASMIGSSDRVE
ncbi:MAG TPA: bifunctional helix-turn-helix transcriptional regulator/GNAT family N-acetyltransferase [Lautropia sp.]|nr:bifunctional helix-turn-helix transcriptional regulator/GNAT family N-acetyltransferase [Lautropia sp.]